MPRRSPAEVRMHEADHRAVPSDRSDPARSLPSYGDPAGFGRKDLTPVCRMGRLVLGVVASTSGGRSVAGTSIRTRGPARRACIPCLHPIPMPSARGSGPTALRLDATGRPGDMVRCVGCDPPGIFEPGAFGGAASGLWFSLPRRCVPRPSEVSPDVSPWNREGGRRSCPAGMAGLLAPHAERCRPRPPAWRPKGHTPVVGG